jgi:hypothetical protein
MKMNCDPRRRSHLPVVGGTRDDPRPPHREMSMIIKTALVAALILGSASMAITAAHAKTHRAHAFHSRNAALPFGYGQGYGSARESWMDRASRSFSGGGY